MIIDPAELKQRYLQRIAGVRDKQVYIGPEIVTLDMTNACNLRCQYCATDHSPGNPHHHDKAQFFSWDKFLEIISDCVELKVDQIDLGGSGEPTVHPRFQDMMRHLEQKPFWVRLVTNATFPLECCDDVIKGDQAVIDLSAVDRQQYRDLQGKDFFDRVVGNIKRLVSLRDTIKPNFLINIAYIVNAVNVDHKQKMQELASQLGVNWVTFTKMNVHEYNRNIALVDDLTADPAGEGERTPPACLNGWFYLTVRLDGNTSTCYQIYQTYRGDIAARSLKELWSSGHMMNMRLLGKYGYIQKKFSSCRHCPFYDENVQRSRDLASPHVDLGAFDDH